MVCGIFLKDWTEKVRMVAINYKEIVRFLTYFVIAMLFLRLTKSIAAYFFIPFVFGIISSKRIEGIFFVLISLSALTISSYVFFEKNIHYFIAVRISFLLFMLSLFLKNASRRTPSFMYPFYLLYLYIGYMMVVSINGWQPIVSELKAFLFLIFIVAFIQGTTLAADGRVDFNKVRMLMLAVCCFFVFGSLAVYPFPSIGRSMIVAQIANMKGYIDEVYLSQIDGLYSGVTMHSQMLGPLLALLNAYLLSDYLLNVQSRGRLYLALMGVIPLLIYLTSSRTAMGGYIASIVVCLYYFLKARYVSGRKKTVVIFNVILLCLIATVIIIISPRGKEKIEAFVRKTQEVDAMKQKTSAFEDVVSSRMGAVEEGMRNFRKSPFIGNGFQVMEYMTDMQINHVRDLLSAPIEKGVLPIMVLEEGGGFGAVIFSIFLIILYIRMDNQQCYGFLSCFTILLTLNSGEAVFFSITALGGTLWMTCFVALWMDIQRLQRSKDLLHYPLGYERRWMTSHSF